MFPSSFKATIIPYQPSKAPVFIKRSTVYTCLPPLNEHVKQVLGDDAADLVDA